MRDASIFMLYRLRIVWLVVFVFGNIFSGAGIAAFEDTIEAYVALVFFLPLLIDSGGNAGSQAATLMVQGLATGDVRMRDWSKMIGREVLIAGLLGVSLAAAVSLIGIFRGGPEIALVVASSMVLIVIVGSVIGMSLPFLLSRLKLDPAAASAPPDHLDRRRCVGDHLLLYRHDLPALPRSGLSGKRGRVIQPCQSLNRRAGPTQTSNFTTRITFMSKIYAGAIAAILLLHAPHAANAETPSTDLFGFTEGTDIAEPGEIGFAFGIEAGFGARPGPFERLTGTLEATIGITDWLEFTPGIGVARTRFFDEDRDAAVTNAGIASLSTGLKFRLLDRAQAPVGVAFKVEPSLNWMDEGVRGFGWGSGFDLMVDRELVPGQLFGALNFSYEFAHFRPRGLNEDGVGFSWDSASEIGLSGALSTHVGNGLFLGAEAAYLRAYEGAGLRRFAGQAVYLGPTLYLPVSNNLELAAAFSTQVWGREAGGEGRLDLGNFNRHRAKFSLSFAF